LILQKEKLLYLSHPTKEFWFNIIFLQLLDIFFCFRDDWRLLRVSYDFFNIQIYYFLESKSRIAQDSHGKSNLWINKLIFIEHCFID
jgi:hypothetical protein